MSASESQPLAPLPELPLDAGVHGTYFTGQQDGLSVLDENMTIHGTFTGKNITVDSTTMEHDIDIGIEEAIEYGGPADFIVEDSSIKVGNIELAEGSAQLTNCTLCTNVIYVRSGWTTYSDTGDVISYNSNHLVIKDTTVSFTNNRFYLYALGSQIHLENVEIQGVSLIQTGEVSKYAADFYAQHVTFGAGSEIQISGSWPFLMERCAFKKGDSATKIKVSRMGSTSEGATRAIRNCDLSNTYFAFSDSGSAVLDLSGNYWGEGYDTVEKVLTLISSPANVVINSVLTENPVPPLISLKAPTLSGVDKGLAQTLISWESEEGSTYRLLVDDKEVYSGSEASFELGLADGEHTYTVVTTDNHGNYRVISDSLSVDTENKAISTADSVPVFTVLNAEASGDGSFSWAVEQANSYKGVCRIAFATELGTHALSYVAITNPDALIEPVPGSTVNICEQTLTFRTGLSAEGGLLTLNSTQSSTSFEVGSTTFSDPKVLENIVFNCGDSGSVFIRTATTMTGGGVYSGSLRAYADLTASNMEVISTGKSDFLAVAGGCTLRLTDVDVSLHGSKGQLCINAGGYGYISGGSLSLKDYTYVQDGALLEISGTKLTGPSGYYLTSTGTVVLQDLSVAAGSYLHSSTDASFTARGVSFGANSEVRIEASSSALLEGCKFGAGSKKSQINIYRGEPVVVTGCNLANAAVTIYKGSGTGTVDLSGNYWGEGIERVEQIAALISGYSAEAVTINSWLKENPLAPKISLNAPVQEKAGESLVKVTFSWSCNSECSYKLLVDGVEVYSGEDSTCTVTLKDGSHSYSLTATDVTAESSTCTDSFSFDATAPAIQLKSPQIQSLGDGRILVTLSWATEAGAACEVWVDGELRETAGNSLTLELEEGAHSYSVKATDAVGNSMAVEDDFHYVALPPTTTFNAPVLKGSKGKTKVTFSWKGEKSTVYQLYVDGSCVMTGTKTKWSGTLLDGEHSYELIATEANGTVGRFGGELFCDATAPDPVLREPEVTKVDTGSSTVTLSWTGEEDVTYTVKVGKEVVYCGSDSSCTFALADGKYNYTVEAVDGAGNKAKAKKGKLVVDTTPPKIAFKEPKYKDLGNGLVQASLSWKGESKAGYILLVDGKEAYSGTKTSCKLTLAAGAHSYTLIATDAAGNSSDTPALELYEPALAKVAEGQSSATFTWNGEAGGSYLLTVDGKKYTTLSSMYSLNLKDGKHKYSLTLTDAAGNSMTQAGSFMTDTKAPKLKVKAPKVTDNKNGTATVEFKWTGEKGATYELNVGGTVYDGLTATSCRLQLEQGVHQYSITATDAAGNSISVADSVYIEGLDYQLALSAGACALPVDAACALSEPACLQALELDARKTQGDIVGLS